MDDCVDTDIKSDYVNSVLKNYLSKRNYSQVSPSSLSKEEFLQHTLIEAESSRSNAISYTCPNSDPTAIDQNFTNFLAWLRDLVNRNKKHADLEYLAGPLFCHLYFEIQRRGHSEKASNFLKSHVPAIGKFRTEEAVLKLINSLPEETVTINEYQSQFQSNKYRIELCESSIQILQKFVAESCHLVFLEILQNWFDLQLQLELEEEPALPSPAPAPTIQVDRKKMAQDDSRAKFERLKQAIADLKTEPPLAAIFLSNTKEEVHCGSIKRPANRLAYSQNNSVRIRTLHTFDSVAPHQDVPEVTLLGHSSQIYSVTISAKAEFLATTSNDATACIFDIANVKLLHTCSGHQSSVYCATFSDPPLFLATGSQDTTLRLWSTETGSVTRILTGHAEAVNGVNFHPNNVYLASASIDRSIRLWDIKTGSKVRVFFELKNIYSLVFHPSGQFLTWASDDDNNSISVWDISKGRSLFQLKNKDGIVSKLKWSQDGKMLCCGSNSGDISIWNIEDVENFSKNPCEEPASKRNLGGRILDIDYDHNSFVCLAKK